MIDNNKNLNIIKTALKNLQIDIYKSKYNRKDFAQKYGIYLDGLNSDTIELRLFKKILKEKYDCTIDEDELIELLNNPSISSFIKWGAQFQSDSHESIRYIVIQNQKD